MFWDTVTTSGDPSQLSLASLWLSRAGSCPRDLFIKRCGPAAPIQSLMARFPFSSIGLGIGNDAEKLDFSEIPIESFLPLKKLSLENSGSDSRQLSLGHHSFPNLKSLYIDRYFDSFSALVTSKTVEKLSISIPAPVPISVCLDILRSATKLRCLDLFVDDAEIVESFQDVVAPNLTHANLCFEYGHSAGPLISALTAPNLRELRMLAQSTISIFNIVKLECDASSFLSKAGQSRMPKLETLSIPGTTRRPVDIGILLRSIPSLRKLTLGPGTILDDDTIRGLASGELGPRLRDMQLYERMPHDPERILAMIEARRGLDIGMGNDSGGAPPPTGQLFYFVFRDCGNLELDEYKRRISDLAQDGIIVQFYV